MFFQGAVANRVLVFFTEDVSLEGVFLQRAIAERAVVFARVVTEWYMVLLF